MDKGIIKNRVGRTPMIRAKKLEKELNVGKIFLKLEGNNPSGHREDRLAYLIIRDALTRGKKTICMGTYGTVGGSLSYLSQYFDIKLIFYVPNKRKVLRKDLLDNEKVELREFGKTYEDCVIESRRVSRENDWYNANPGLANNVMNMYAFSYIGREVVSYLEGDIDDIYCQTSSGSSISGLHLGLKQIWITEELERVPKINAVATSHGNAIVESFNKGLDKIEELDRKKLKGTRTNRNTLNWKCFNGQDALNSIHDTGGRAIGVSDDDVKKYAKKIRKKERIKITAPNAYPVAAFIKDAEEGRVEKGNHILILNDGRVGVDIRRMTKEDLNVSYEEFLDILDEWLVQFTDPKEEMTEAVDNAFRDGMVFCAFYQNDLVGISILSRSHWDEFFPLYHLSYIATKKGLKGMGIATQLMQKSVDATDGSLSLHVETDNRRAIKLYEKMGFRKKYYRMLYKGSGE